MSIIDLAARRQAHDESARVEAARRQAAARSPEGLAITRELNQVLEARLDDNDFLASPPQKGVKYIAHGVRPDGPAPGRGKKEKKPLNAKSELSGFEADEPGGTIPFSRGGPTLKELRLLAVVIAHLDNDGEVIIDHLMQDTDTDAIAPTLRAYGLLKLTDLTIDEVGYPLAQAFGYAFRTLREPPPPVPHECTSWRHMLLHHRICEIRDAEYKAASSIWENGVMVRELPFDGAAVERLVNDAIEHFEADDLDRAERRCELAERKILGEGRH